jgi:hypothetical protein
VLDTGLWIDRYQSRDIGRAIDADVVARIPVEEVHAAGGWNWDRATRDAYLTDLAHPAMYDVVGVGSGHNPRRETPSDWRPGAESAWCAYAVDWIAVKHRWSLGVGESERVALIEMLSTCDDSSSAGADPATTPLEEPARPPITFLNS